MPQWHAPCWRRILPCPGCPRAAYCAASFIWFCLSQWPLFRDLARSGRQGQSEAAQNKSCFAVLSCFPVLFLFCFWPVRRLSPRKMLRPLTRSFFQPRKTRSMKSQSKICSLDYDEIKVPGGFVDWRYCRKIVKEYRFPTVVPNHIPNQNQGRVLQIRPCSKEYSCKKNDWTLPWCRGGNLSPPRWQVVCGNPVSSR